MKRFINLGIYLLLAITSVFAIDKEEFCEFVYGMNSICPLDTGNGTLNYFNYSSTINQLTIDITFNADATSIANINANKEMMGNAILNNWKLGVPQLLEYCSDLNVDIKISINVGEQSTSIFIPAATVKEKLDSKESDNDIANQALAVMIENERRNIPSDFGNGLVWVDLKLDNDKVTYVYTVDESIIPISAIQETKTAQHDMILQSLLTNDLVRGFITNVILTGRHLRYDYKGKNSATVVTVIITNDELKANLK